MQNFPLNDTYVYTYTVHILRCWWSFPRFSCLLFFLGHNMSFDKSQCFLNLFPGVRLWRLSDRINLYAQNQRHITADATGKHLKIGARFASTSSGSCKQIRCKHFFTSTTVLYPQLFCWTSYSFIQSTLFSCSAGTDFIPACRPTFSMTSKVALRRHRSVSTYCNCYATSTHRRTFSALPRVGMCRQCPRPRATNVRHSGRVRATMRLMSVFLFRIKGRLCPNTREHERPSYTSRATNKVVRRGSNLYIFHLQLLSLEW
jgi:hypothetical protein